MDQQVKRMRELCRYAAAVAREDGLPAVAKRTAGFVRRRFFGKKARYLPAKKVLEAQRARYAGTSRENCGLPTISILTPDRKSVV